MGPDLNKTFKPGQKPLPTKSSSISAFGTSDRRILIQSQLPPRLVHEVNLLKYIHPLSYMLIKCMNLRWICQKGYLPEIILPPSVEKFLSIFQGGIDSKWKGPWLLRELKKKKRKEILQHHVNICHFDCLTW